MKSSKSTSGRLAICARGRRDPGRTKKRPVGAHPRVSSTVSPSESRPGQSHRRAGTLESALSVLALSAPVDVGEDRVDNIVQALVCVE